MTVRPGFPAVSGAATFQDIRRSLAGTVVKSAAGVLRTGILPIGTGPLMTGTASMVVNVQTCVVVLDRNGAVFLPNDGVQTVQLSSAPSSGSRWSVIYAKQREAEAPFSDAAAGPLIDKVESTTSETAARNLLPAGARELGVWKIDAGATTTNAASGVTYTETVPYTAMEGGVVLLRNQTEQDAWAPHDGALAARLDTGALLERVSGAWAFVVQRKTAFTPNWENLLVGAGTNVGEYSIVGDRCRGEAKMQFGSGWALNSNGVLLNPPVTPRDVRGDTPVGQVVILDAGQGWVAGWLMLTSAGKFELRTYGSPYSNVVNGTGSPFNFAASDVISVIFDYRV